MIIVSDTTPLHYLILIGKTDILPTLFGEIVIPNAVLTEIMHERAPRAVLEWISEPPDWLLIKPAPLEVVEEIKGLGKGETEAIAIALEEHADALLMDDKKAIREARFRGLVVITTLGILELAAVKKIIDFQTVLDELRRTSFRLPPDEIIHEFLERDRTRRAR